MEHVTQLPKLQELQALWESKRRDGLLPARNDFDVIELGPWLGHISLIEILDGGRDFQYRLHGTWSVDTLGMDLTGKKVSDLPTEMQDIARAEHVKVITRHEPVCFVRERFNRDTDHRKIVRLSMPLATDGRTADMLLSCVYFAT